MVEVMEKYEQTAHEFVDAIKIIANREDAINNFEMYLSRHFGVWLEKFANTPETLTGEMECFANMEF